MQTIAEVQAACDALAVLMAEKGLIRPSAAFKAESHREPRVITYGDGSGENYCNFFPSFAMAEEWVRALPSPEERHRNEFLTLAAKAADYAATHLVDDPIAAEVRATIVAGMKRLSENALTAA